MAHVSLRDKCSVNTNIDTDTFVGVKAIDGDISISFPLGFRLSDDDKELRKDILLLLNVLSKNTERRDSEINYEIILLSLIQCRGIIKKCSFAV